MTWANCRAGRKGSGWRSRNLPEITDVDTDLQPGGLEADLIVDRDAASRLG